MKQIRFSHLKMSGLSRVLIAMALKLVVRCIQIEGTPTACYIQECTEGAAACDCALKGRLEPMVSNVTGGIVQLRGQRATGHMKEELQF
jgi:hypothetical protein